MWAARPRVPGWVLTADWVWVGCGLQHKEWRNIKIWSLDEWNDRTAIFWGGRQRRENGCETDGRTWRLNSGAIKINVPWSYSGRIGVRNLGFRGEDRVGRGRTYSLNPWTPWENKCRQSTAPWAFGGRQQQEEDPEKASSWDKVAVWWKETQRHPEVSEDELRIMVSVLLFRWELKQNLENWKYGGQWWPWQELSHTPGDGSTNWWMQGMWGIFVLSLFFSVSLKLFLKCLKLGAIRKKVKMEYTDNI